MGDIEKKLKDLKGTDQLKVAMQYVAPFFRPFKKELFWVAVLAGLTNIFEPTLAVSIKFFMDYVFIKKIVAMIYMVPCGLYLLFIIREVCNYNYDYNRERLGLKVVRNLQCYVYGHFMGLSHDHFDRMSTGEMMSRTTNDVSRMQATVPMVIDFFKHCLKLIALTAVCLWMQPYLTAITFITVPIIAWPVQVIGDRMRSYTKKGMRQAAFINMHMQETYSGARIVKAFSQEGEESKRYRGNMEKMLQVQFKYARSKSLQGPLTNLISMIGVCVVLGISIDWLIIGKISQPNFMAFFTALGLMATPLRELSKIQGQFQTTFGSIERINQVLSLEPTVKEAPDAVELEPMQKNITYDNVSFKYLNQWVLNDFNMLAKKGDLIALVGPSGSGKSTVANLLPRFYDATKGTVSIDGIDVKKISFKSLRGQIGIVTQETFLFNDTVENNIKYGSAGKTYDQVVEAAAAANAHDFITRLPAGYQTVIGERGVRLSGGERQRIAIARALLKNPPILLLDEATSSLDTESEREVQKALDNLMKNRTTVAIAHRLSTVRNADRIIVLSNGRIVEQGTHEQLIAGTGLYRKLYQMQFLIDETPEMAEELQPERGPIK